MRTRRRIDWSEITAPGTAVPVWREDRLLSPPLELLLELESLFAIREADDLLKRVVELALDPIGLVRAGAYVYDETLDLMLGTWGTDLSRTVVDEHHGMFRHSDANRRVFERSLSGQSHWTVVEDCPMIVNDAHETKVVGRGWVVCTPIRSARHVIGMLYNDAGLTGAPIDQGKQARTAALCFLAGTLLERMRGSARGREGLGLTLRHPAVAKALRMLADDPSLSGAQIAAKLDVSLSRFARVFKAEMHKSLVQHRNELRLERFDALSGAGRTNLLEAALAAGFGSYAQFHRVFRAVRGVAPREQLGKSSPAKAAARRAKRSPSRVGGRQK